MEKYNLNFSIFPSQKISIFQQLLNSYMIYYLLFLSLLCLTFSDCPLSHFPRRTTLGFIDAQFTPYQNEDTQLKKYQFTLQDPFSEGITNIAMGVVGLEVKAENRFKFDIEHAVSSDLDKVKFRIEVFEVQDRWVSLKFNFIASQSPLFQMRKIRVSQFSTGLSEGNYAVYQPIPDLNKFGEDPFIKIFICGLHLERDLEDEESKKIEDQYINFKALSNNSNFIQYFQQVVVEAKGFAVQTQNVKIKNNFLSFSVKTKSNLLLLSFTYILLDKKAYEQKHNKVNNDFSLLYQQSFTFTGLVHMDMIFIGLNSFNIPSQSQSFSFSLTFSNYLGKSTFHALTTHPFLTLQFTFIAFQMKQNYVCQDCQNSPIIYRQFCVSNCPRTFSQVTRFNNTFCEKCSIQDLKVIDPDTNRCVCAKRHYLNSSTNACSPCPYDCMACSSPDKCDTCDNQLLQTKRIMKFGRCRCQQIGYYDNQLNKDIVCQKCHRNCLTCYGGNSHDCLSCDSDKELDKFGNCQCRNNFRQTRDGKCICQYPYERINEHCLHLNDICDSNQHYQLIEGVSVCVCNFGYTKIFDDCVKCEENQVFDEKSFQCKCVNETMMVEGKCIPCGQNQIYDKEEQICVCKENTFETENRQCIKCPPKMIYEKGQCECIFNYFENREGICQKCVRDTDGPKCRRIIL